MICDLDIWPIILVQVDPIEVKLDGQCHHGHMMETNVQNNLAKGRIADLSPLVAANGFVRSLPPSNTWFIGPT